MILGILQARVSSSRLPGKVLKSILDKPMIVHEVERIIRSKYIDKMILATSMDKSDDPLADLCNKYDIEVFRGDLEDVLDRFYQSCLKYNPKHVVRLTGDCPLIDWNTIDDVIRLHLAENNDYTSNTLIPTYPDGLDVEICTFQALKEAWQVANLSTEREHVTFYINQRPEKFKLGCLKNSKDLSDLRWTVDEVEDFELVSEIYQELYKKNKFFTIDDILSLLEQKIELKTMNKKYVRNEGLKKSLKKDQELLKKRD